MTITLKNVTPELHLALKTRAATFKRSLNQEVLYCLESIVDASRKDAHEILDQVRKIRESSKGPELTREWILKGIEEGRS
jgi:plasmid stability protein